jgi:inhibitor of KinA
MNYSFKQLGDRAMLVEFEQRIDLKINRQVMSLRDQLIEQNVAAVEYLTPAFCSLTIGFDPEKKSFDEMTNCVNGLSKEPELAKERFSESKLQSNFIRIPVCYDLVFALDLADVAVQTGLTAEQVVQVHLQSTYHAYMLGFLPGFAYLGSVDPSIQVGRKSNPRTEIPAGSVGLAGPQTGVYPATAPGGWQIIGRTPLKIFDTSRSQPFLIEPGDQVQFYSIDQSQFVAMSDRESG